MPQEIPYDRWSPLTVAEVAQLFAGAPFTWGLAGGYALELFASRPLREHDDIDVLVFRDEQQLVQRWLRDWHLFAADPPGTLRPWRAGEELPYGIHDIWGHRPGSDAWQLQLMLAEAEGGEWFSRRDRRVRGPRDGLFAKYGDLPCLRPEVQLFYKAHRPRPKDEQDFAACLPLLDPAARAWLAEQLRLVYGEGHGWVK
ncbi:MAG TPA: hypothetical protein VFS21_09445 [Roseiflexaceae bacterium]|nr:hypothetical protein [Roseiflexaceae bacterium]